MKLKVSNSSLHAGTIELIYITRLEYLLQQLSSIRSGKYCIPFKINGRKVGWTAYLIMATGQVGIRHAAAIGELQEKLPETRC